mmetsp:Transcript_6869/g.9833  ORF Transcript_6869/g.9833 Transcript_6869/m.9833 type:complete len:263 (-) Transcript_6869:44-832(-)
MTTTSQMMGWLLGMQALLGYVLLVFATALNNPSSSAFGIKIVMNVFVVGPAALMVLFVSSVTFSAYERYQRRLTLLYNGAMLVEGKSAVLATHYFGSTHFVLVTHKLEYIVNGMLYEKSFKKLEFFMTGIHENNSVMICYIPNRPETAIPRKVLENEITPLPFWFRGLGALLTGFFLLCFYSLLDLMASLDTWPFEYWSFHWVFFFMMYPFVYFLVDVKWADKRIQQFTSRANLKESSSSDFVFIAPNEGSSCDSPQSSSAV